MRFKIQTEVTVCICSNFLIFLSMDSEFLCIYVKVRNIQRTILVIICNG